MSHSHAQAGEDLEPATYGLRPDNPVRVGWGDQGVMAFFDLLRGPQGQRVAWRRLASGSDAVNPRQGLETFEVTYEGLEEPVRLYVDPHTSGPVRAPRGFAIEGLSAKEPADPEDEPKTIEL